MKQLTVFEMEAVSGGAFTMGAYTWDFSSFESAVSSVVYNAIDATIGVIGGAAIGAMAGSIIGGRWGGAGGGILGIGTIGQGVGMIWGAGLGAIGAATLGAFVGYTAAWPYGLKALDAMMNGTINLWS